MQRFLLFAAAAVLAAIMVLGAPHQASAQGWCSDAAGGTTDCNAPGAIYHADGDTNADPPAPRASAAAQPQGAPRERATYNAPVRQCKDGPHQANGCYYACSLNRVVCPTTGNESSGNGYGTRIDGPNGSVNNNSGSLGYASQGMAQNTAESQMEDAAKTAPAGSMVDGYAYDPLTGAQFNAHAVVVPGKPGSVKTCAQIGPNGPNQAYLCTK